MWYDEALKALSGIRPSLIPTPQYTSENAVAVSLIGVVYCQPDRAAQKEVEDSGLIPSRTKSMTLKLVFTVFLLDAQH